MSVLKYKNRGMSIPGKIPNIYFCCNRPDFDLFFNTISRDILEQCNCTIWYRTDFDSDYDDAFFFELSQMQLFVIPITTSFLYSSKSVLHTEFSFALQTHIPILPLLLESSLSDLFHQKCGSLQYLNPLTQGPESYIDKLGKYLNGILYNDTLSQRIDEAFQAKLFLSYRREDKVYAQNIMRMIHDCNGLSDLSIWYDEFLPLGNFHHSIRNAILCCDAFLLTVTPNLVAKENYVMTTEYPMAVQMEKPILPVEMVPTNDKLLCERFPHIPPCINAYSSNHLESSLIDILKIGHGTATAWNPEKYYLLGLAYLNGIGLELDRNRAPRFITHAANLGFIEACAKLAEMYRFGIAVKQSSPDTIFWLRKKIELLEIAHSQNPSPVSLDILFWEYLRCSDYCIECDNFNTGEELLYKGISLIEAYPNWNEDSILIRDVWAGKSTLARLLSTNKQYERALEENHRALSILLSSNILDELHPYHMDLSLTYGQIGNIYLENGNLTSAKEYFIKAHELSLLCVEDNQTIEARQYLAASYHDLADISYAEGNLTKALSYLSSQYDLLTVLADETRTLQDQRNLVLSCNERANVCLEIGDIEAAKAAAQESLNISKRIAKKSTTVYDLRNMSISYDRLGNIYQSIGDIEQAQCYYIRSLSLCYKMLRISNSIESRFSLSVAYDNLGGMWSLKGILSKATVCYQQSLDLRIHILSDSPTVESRRNLAVSYSQMGQISLKAGKLGDAITFYQKSLDIRLSLHNELATPQSKRDLAAAYDSIGLTQESSGLLKQAVDSYQNSMSIRTELMERNRNAQTVFAMLSSYDRMGEILSAMNDTKKAYQYHYQASMLCNELIKYSNIPENRQALSACYLKLGDIELLHHNHTQAMEWFQKALTICSELKKEGCLVEAARDLSVCYERIVELLCEESKWSQARPYQEQCLAIRQELAKTQQTSESKQDLSISYSFLGDIHLHEKSFTLAKDCYESSLSICTELVEHYDAVLYLRDYAVAYCKLGDYYFETHQTALARTFYEKCQSLCIQQHNQLCTPQSEEDLKEIQEKLTYCV